MSRTCMVIDIRSVRLCIDDIGLCSQCIKHALCDHPGTSVCTVQSHTHIFIRIGCQWDQISHIAVSSCCIINGASDFFADCKRYICHLFPEQIQFAINVILNIGDRLLIHLLAVSIDQLDAIIIERIVAGRNHNTAVKILGSCHIRNRWCSRYMKQICICPGCCQTSYQRIFKHVAGTSGIFSDYHFTFFSCHLMIVPSDKTTHFVCMFHC